MTSETFDWLDEVVLDTLRRWVGEDLAPDDDLFEAGARSVALMSACAELSESLGHALDLSDLLTSTTARQIASLVRDTRFEADRPGGILFRRGRADRGYVLLLPDYWDLIHARDTLRLVDASVLLICPFLDYSVGRSWRPLPQWADDVAAVVHQHCPAGALVIGGFCAASLLAAEVALRLAGRVRLLVLFEPDLPASWTPEHAPLGTLLGLPKAATDRPDVARCLRQAERCRLDGSDGKRRALELLRPVVMEHVEVAPHLPGRPDPPPSLPRAMASRWEGMARLVLASHDHAAPGDGRAGCRADSTIFVVPSRRSHERAHQQRCEVYWTGGGHLQGTVRYRELEPDDRHSRHPDLTPHHTILVHPAAMAAVNDALR